MILRCYETATFGIPRFARTFGLDGDFRYVWTAERWERIIFLRFHIVIMLFCCTCSLYLCILTYIVIFVILSYLAWMLIYSFGESKAIAHDEATQSIVLLLNG